MQIYSYTGYAYIFGTPINSRPIYLEVEANSFKQARNKIKYRIKNWISLYHYDKIEIDDDSIKEISEQERRDMGHRKIILAQGCGLV